MKKNYITLIFIITFVVGKSATYTVNISGFTYSPATLTVNIGDVVTIQANSSHPLIEVDQTTWTAGGTSTLTTGFGVKNSNYTFTVSTTNTIYYACQFHAGMGMKGKIDVSIPTSIDNNSFNENEIKLFPNPTKGNFILIINSELVDKFNVKLFSITGQEISIQLNQKGFSKHECVSNFTLPENISKGLYLMEVKFDNRKVIKKLILE